MGTNSWEIHITVCWFYNKNRNVYNYDNKNIFIVLTDFDHLNETVLLSLFQSKVVI